MRLDASTLRFSPTDLAAFSACQHKTLLDRLRALGQASAPAYPDPRLDLLRERGAEHEQRFLEQLENEGRRIVRFEGLAKEDRHPEGYRRRHEETLAAMAEGPDVIYQGTLYDGEWLGLVDFLIRVERASGLGGWSYEVVDAKLAREAKAAAVLQMCVYSELLARAQGLEPERIHLYLGGPSPRLESFRLAHFAAYYRALRGRFKAHLASPPAELPVAPDPVEHCQVCDWKGRCTAERLEADHLSLVAGIARDHRRALEAVGVTTLEGLANLPLEPPPEGLRTTGFQRIREQARVQLEGRRRDAPYHETLPPDTAGDGQGLGLAALPEPHAHDLFFDIEGADFAFDHGLEYLFGVSDEADGYEAAWALNPHEEKAVLGGFLARTLAHVQAHPGAHVYHFGHYEPSALKRLVGRYGVGAEELDTMLRGGVFVDLHRVVKQGVRASVESYSLKALEPFHGFARDVDLGEANPARARLEYALAAGLTDDEALEDRPVVERYNRDDCVSTRALRDWLEGLRDELVRAGTEVPRPTPQTADEEAADESEVALEVRQLLERLLQDVPEERQARDDEQQVRWLAAHLLEWHRREDKSAWWEYFRLKELTLDELVEEAKPLAHLEYEGVVGEEKQSWLHRYRFPAQEHRISGGSQAEDWAIERQKRTVWAVDDAAGTVDLKVGKRTPWDPAALRALLPDEIVRTDDLRARLRETARRLLDGSAELAAWSPASRALLHAEKPTFGNGVRLPAVAPAGATLERAREAALRLDPGVLPVQGPPGTGKTYSGARMIRALLRAGYRVGVTGPSHKVIINLLDEICSADRDDEATPIVGLQVSGDLACADARIESVKSSNQVTRAEAQRAEEGLAPFNLVAGTAWLWATDHRLDSVDVLVIDEAGQFSLANALAVAPAAPRLVLLGDPQQLNQPQKGLHPPGSEVSVLEHLVDERGILGQDQGLFLAETWRMRPEITAFTSELFYESQLGARPDLDRQRITLAGGARFEGLHLEAVPHEGNVRESDEETAAVVRLFRRFLAPGTQFTDRHGATRPLTLDDLLVVAPYNAQVSRLAARLAEAGFPGARAGTVDKFQGQEAPVALYSLASSSADDAPRGMAFLYALDRLNVATSRARCATVVVASPEVLLAEARRPDQMRMVNALVRYGELSGG